ncbi:NAD(P)/FAD-dependent oxidoreductase [Pontibacillus salipaludis]|uniref:NADH dehydrogenase-like protein YutJ n=1 Tax=Pontibacillus salipaludis TaxID=1697394 RepID=A0ABQ1PRG2_9BACI|nr:NAD(P)/FAD-dependent oxidoreductase [Pontibacillus salipaludis]GGD02104.1 NADH dehydrogenase-like protein YutJ [Pontibacillus salipaludis]
MKRLVIVGGGYGGLKILQDLLEGGLPKDVHITMVDRNPYHSLKTEFYAIAAGTKADREVRIDFPEHDQVDYVFGEVMEINIHDQQIVVREHTDPVPYDDLVIGLGCEDNYHGVQGAPEYTQSVQTFKKARKAGFEVGNLNAHGKVAVVGAGLSGIEVASEIRESRPDLNIRLLDRGETVLRPFDPKIQEYVEDWFKRNDVEVIHHANVEYVERDGVCNNGICFVNDVTIWTAGVRPNHLVRALPFEKDPQEKIIINDYYQVPEQPNVYIVGDCASSNYSPSGQLAGQQGEHIAAILLALYNGKEPDKPKEVKLKGSLGSLGKSDGFGNMMQKPVTGLLPRLAKSGVLWLHRRH